MALLRVSRTIHEEARDIVWEQAKDWIMPHPARIIGSYYVGLEVLADFIAGIHDRKGYMVEDDDPMVLCTDVAQGKYLCRLYASSLIVFTRGGRRTFPVLN